MLKWTLPISLIMTLNVHALDGNSNNHLDLNIFEGNVLAGNTKTALTKLLSSMTLSNDGFYNKAISPAKSLNLALNDASRIEEVNFKIISEMDALSKAFKIAPEDKKVEETRKIIAQIDPDIIKNNGANIQVINGSPSAAFSRTFIMIEKKPSNPSATTERLLGTLSSYKRSAIPRAYTFEYSDSRNLNQSSVKKTEGTDVSWKPPFAAQEITMNQDLVLKKCRQIMGWKCVTSLYQTGQLLTGADKTKYLYAGIYNITSNTDHPDFANDKRSFNQITGSTALYIIRESPSWILLYGVDSQWNEGSISFVSLIQDEFLKDSKRIKERIRIDLAVSPDEIK